MPTAITPPTPFDPAVAASKLPSSLQWLGGAVGSVAKDLTGAGDPNQSVMGVGNPMMAADTELSPLAQALYSRVQKVADALPDWIHPAKAASLFKNASSKEEQDYRGLSDLLANRQGPDKISKAEIQAHLAANPVPQVGVQTLSGPTSGNVDAGPRPQYNRPDLNVPGGKNYTESLFTLPADSRRARVDKAAQLFKDNGISLDISGGLTNGPNDNARFSLRKWGSGFPSADNKVHPQDLSPELQQAWNSLIEPVNPGYTSSHWDTPNVLAHTREDIRPDSTGQIGKFLQEIQSDWHQQGKNEGYQSKRIMPGPEDYIGRDYIGRGPEEGVVKGVPEAPFKDSWPDLTLKKHVLDVANSPDQNWLGFTTGKTQADRYNLAHHVDRLEYEITGSGPHRETGLESPSNGILWGYKDGNTVLHKPDIAPETVRSYLGNDVTNKLLSPQNIDQWREHYMAGSGGYQPMVSGQDLQVGGEGMNHFYDQVLPSRLNKILKPFGGSVEQGNVELGRKSKMFYDSSGRVYREDPGVPITTEMNHIASAYPRQSSDVPNHAKELKDLIQAQPQNISTTPAWIARLTPEMKAAIQKNGLPLMSLLLARQAAKQNAIINPPDQSGQ